MVVALVKHDLVVEYRLPILGCKTLSLFWHCFRSYFVYWKLGQNVGSSTYSLLTYFQIWYYVDLEKFPEFGPPQAMVFF